MAYPSPRILNVIKDTGVTGSGGSPQNPMPDLTPGTTHRLFVFASDSGISSTISVSGPVSGSYTWDVIATATGRNSAQKLLSVDKCPNGSTVSVSSIYWSILLYVDLELPPSFSTVTNFYSGSGSTFSYQIIPVYPTNLVFTCFQARGNSGGPLDSFGGATLLYGSGYEGTFGVQVTHTLDPVTVTASRSNGYSDDMGPTTLAISFTTNKLQATVDGETDAESLIRNVAVPMGVADIPASGAVVASLNGKRAVVRKVSMPRPILKVLGDYSRKPYMAMLNVNGRPQSGSVKILKPNMGSGGGGGGGGGFDGIDGQGWPRGSKGPS